MIACGMVDEMITTVDDLIAIHSQCSAALGCMQAHTQSFVSIRFHKPATSYPIFLFKFTICLAVIV